MSWRPLLLSLLAPVALAGGPFNGADHSAEGLVLLPDARGKEAPDRAFDLLSLHLEVDLEPRDRALAGTATYTMRRLGPGPLVLDQVALSIEEVTVDGVASGWRVEADTLVIEPGGERGSERTVRIRYSARPRSGLHFRGEGSDTFAHVFSQGEDDENRYWFPAWDHPNDRFAYTGEVRAPEGWRAMTNPTDDLVSYLVMLAAGPYEEVGDARVSAWVPPGTPREAVARVLDPIPAMMDHFAERTGVAYPWGSYRQIFVQRFLYTGMENTGATIEDAHLLRTALVGGRGLDVESVVAHELAHQWYGDLLTCRSWRELWLNEGFATFMANDWMARAYGEDEAAEELLGNFGASLDGPPLAGRFHQGAGAPENGRVYSKGASVLHMLRVMLGEQAFWAGVRRYTKENQKGLVDSEDLRDALERESGQELGWFFQQWVELGHVPSLTVRSRWAEGRTTVTVRQELGPKKPTYTLPITVELGTAEGPVRLSGWLDDGELELSAPSAEPPRYVAFDPDKGVLARVDQTQEPAAWEAQLKSTSPFARLVALRALGDTDHAAPLVAVLQDPARGVPQRRAAASALGQQRRVEPLLVALGDADPEIRQAAASALGKTTGPVASEALQRCLKREPNHEVLTSCLYSLGAVEPAAALAPARRHLGDRERWREGLRRAAADVLGEHGSEADLRLLLDPKLPFVRPFSTLYAAISVANRVEGEAARERALASVARAAERLLEDEDLRGRQTAVAVLGEVGDRQSVALLEAFWRAETERELQQSARDALSRIRSRAAEPTTPNEEKVRLEALEKRLEELQAELDGLRDRH